MGKICSSEESKFRRADGAFGRFEESFMVEMGLIKQSLRLSGALPTIQSPAATKSAGRVLRILFTAHVAAAFIIIIFFGCFPFQCVHSFDP